MNKNAVIPYILIFSLGIGLIFFMSIYGLGQKEEIASQGEDGKTEEGTDVDVADFDAEVAQGKCIGCHGGDLTGGMGGAAPSLIGTSLSKDDIVDILNNGLGAMPAQVPNAIPAEHVDEMAEYILSLK
ncbi:c-type cytochrome [Sporosarcina siberiensis]|uniref:C-type cytochrome n=1 Tax=Sporosarcina siberiensis TaxID=1365606 RepID=A0ABW4SBA8_9BACL